jgi:hypothetical protein
VAALPLRNRPSIHSQECGWAPGQVRTDAEKTPTQGFDIRSVDYPRRSESLHRLRCSGQHARTHTHIYVYILMGSCKLLCQTPFHSCATFLLYHTHTHTHTLHSCATICSIILSTRLSCSPCYFQAFVRYVFNHCITVCHCSDENELEEAFPLLQTSFNFCVCWNVVEDTSLAFLGGCESTASPPPVFTVVTSS